MTRARGEGSVYKNKERNGTWIAQLRVNGRKVKRSANSERDAVRLLAQMRRDRDAGRDPTRLTISEFMDQWLDHKHTDGTRVNTLRGYESKSRVHIVPHLGPVTLAALTPRHVEEMTKEMIAPRSKTKKPKSAQTAAHARSVLANALHDAERWGLVERNVAELAVPPRVDAEERTALTAAQARKLLTVLQGHDWEAAYLLAAIDAMREGEVLAFYWQDFDLDAGTVKISRTVRTVLGEQIYETTKSARSRRALPLPSVVVTCLRERKKIQAAAQLACPPGMWHKGDLVFTGPTGLPVSPKVLLSELRVALKAAGLPPVTYHDLRHSANSVMADLGVSARVRADMLGHAHVSTNEDKYTHSFDPALREAVDRVEAALSAPRTAPQGGR